jgi:hypothetical protein
MDAKQIARKNVRQILTIRSSAQFGGDDPDFWAERNRVRNFHGVLIAQFVRLEGPGPPYPIPAIRFRMKLREHGSHVIHLLCDCKSIHRRSLFRAVEGVCSYRQDTGSGRRNET